MRNISERKGWAVERNICIDTVPEISGEPWRSCTHRGGRRQEAGLEVTACPHAVMHVAVLVVRRSTASWILQYWTPLLHHCPHAKSEKGVWSTTAVFHPKGMSKSRSLAGKQVPPTQQSCQQSSTRSKTKTLGRLPCGHCCFFLVFSVWWKENCSGSHCRAALLCALQEVIAQPLISTQWYNGIGSL